VVGLAARVAETGATLLVLGDVPLLYGAFGVNCAPPGDRAACDRAAEAASPARRGDAERAWEAAAGVAFFSTFDLFCDGGTCGAFLPGTDILSHVDYGHLTAAGSLHVAPYLACYLERVLGPADLGRTAACPASVADA